MWNEKTWASTGLYRTIRKDVIGPDVLSLTENTLINTNTNLQTSNFPTYIWHSLYMCNITYI